MPDIVYYCAQSVDGYIATPDGGIEWLNELLDEGEDYGFHAFTSSVDSLIMGRGTYDKLLGFGSWPYGELPAWVLTHRPAETLEGADLTFVDEGPEAVVAQLEEAGKTRAWLVGGGRAAAAFADAGLIDTWRISVIPVALGEGIPLVAPLGGWARLNHEDTRAYPTGLVQTTYTLRGDPPV